MSFLARRSPWRHARLKRRLFAPVVVILEGWPAPVVGDARRTDGPLLVCYPALQMRHDVWGSASPASGFDVARGEA